MPTEKQPHFKCPECGIVSYNPNDILFGYCGRCHEFTGGGDGYHKDKAAYLFITWPLRRRSSFP